jgi:hypothetical protein
MVECLESGVQQGFQFYYFLTKGEQSPSCGFVNRILPEIRIQTARIAKAISMASQFIPKTP